MNSPKKPDELEIQTKLVNRAAFKKYSMLSWVFAGLLFCSLILVGGKGPGPIKLLFRSFIYENLGEKLSDLIVTVNIVNLCVSTILVGFTISRMSHFSNLGFLKINGYRMNVKGTIFQWAQVSSVEFTINSPKILGERQSTKSGFGNWLVFNSNGHTYKYEFYLGTQKAEDTLLELIGQIKASDGPAKVTVVHPTQQA